MDQQKTQWFSLYHSLQHYKYHTYLMCKDEVRHPYIVLQLVLQTLFILVQLCCIERHYYNNDNPPVCASALQIASLRVQAGDLGQEETVQKCLQNGAWVEGLFDRFGELINQVQQACR